MKEKRIGKLKIVLEDIDGTGDYIQLNPDELAKCGFKTGDWVKWGLTDAGEIVIEKASADDVVCQL